jgi:hypothetical protein
MWLSAPTPFETRLIETSQGRPSITPANGALEAAISTGFGEPKLADWAHPLIAEQKIGEAILRSLVDIERSRNGDTTRLGTALLTLRYLGLESAAREISIYLLLAHADT